MGEILRPVFNKKEDPLREGLSSNGLVYVVGAEKHASNEPSPLVFEFYPAVIEDLVNRSTLDKKLIDKELQNWRAQIAIKGFIFFLRSAINSTKEDWIKYPEKYIALTIELRSHGTEGEPLIG